MKNVRHKSNEIRQTIGKLPDPKTVRSHRNMLEHFGVARPGKTAADKVNGHVPYRKNRREGTSAKKAKKAG